jgi:hypothetical protein
MSAPRSAATGHGVDLLAGRADAKDGIDVDLARLVAIARAPAPDRQ